MKQIILFYALVFFIINSSFSQTIQPKLDWAISCGNTGSQVHAQDSEVDANGNIYTIGYFAGTIDFDPSSNSHLETSSSLNNVNYQNNVYISKLDSSGNFVWVKTFGPSTQTTGQGFGYSIDLDRFENIYATGRFIGTIDFDPDTGIFELGPNPNSSSIFVIKLNSNGSLNWVHPFGTKGDNYGLNVVVDESNNVIFSGTFVDTVDFDPGTPVFNLESYPYIPHAFILKLSPSGGFIWAKSINGTGSSIVKDITCDLNSDIILTGSVSEPADLDPGPDTFLIRPYIEGVVFVAKLNNNGHLKWAFARGIPCTDNLYHVSHVVTDYNNNVYVSGFYRGEIDFDPSNSPFFMTAHTYNFNTHFVQKLTPSGELIWAKGNKNGDAGPVSAIDTEGNLYAINSADGVIDLDPSSGSYITNSGKYYIQKLDSNGYLVWAKRGGSHGNIAPINVHLLESNNFLVAGSFDRGWDIDFDPDSTVSLLSAPGLSNMFFLKFEQKLAVGTKEVYSNSDFIVYPNPTTSTLIIETDQWVNTEVVLYDVTGNMVLKNTLTGNSTLLDISSAPTGIYFVTIISENGLVVKKVIKQ